MPALITHDFFGRDVYASNKDLLGFGEKERLAFLLGNQGPDPLFFLVLSPRMKKYGRVGSIMHRLDPALLLVALKESLDALEDGERSIGRAYLAGFYCHYLLDRSMHPLVYSQQFALCDAGIEGLTRKQGGDVHAEIEREFDEMVLFAKTGRTVRTFKPHREVLRADDATLTILGKMIEFACIKALRTFPPTDMFSTGVKNFRLAQSAFYSPGQRRANAAAFIETRILHRGGSFFKAMSHRDRAETTSVFANESNAPWENPYTHETSTKSFWDIFDEGVRQAGGDLRTLLLPVFDAAAAELLTRGINFSGKPAPMRPELLSAEANDE